MVNASYPQPTQGATRLAMLFDPVDDIPNIDTARVSLPKLDKMMSEMVRNCSFALRYTLNLKKKAKYRNEVGRLISDHLNLFVSTHRSLRSLLRRAFREADFPLVSDAVSLGREQVEKVFNLALLFSNPDKWLMIYLRSSLKSDFEEYLLRLEEYGDIPRMQDFLKVEYPKYIESIRCPSPKLRIGPKELTSKFALRVLEYKWKNPGAPPPAWYHRSVSPSSYIKKRFEFPTPGTAIPKINNKKLRKFLTRWYKDYQYLCQYSHISLRKMIMPVMHESKNLQVIEYTKGVVQKESEMILTLSYAATATACAMAMTGVKNTFGADSNVKDFWHELIENSLLSKALWNLYIKDLLK